MVKVSPPTYPRCNGPGLGGAGCGLCELTQDLSVPCQKDKENSFLAFCTPEGGRLGSSLCPANAEIVAISAKKGRKACCTGMKEKLPVGIYFNSMIASQVPVDSRSARPALGVFRD